MSSAPEAAAGSAGIPFWKYHGLGNDYLVIEAAAVEGVGPLPALARALCARHHGPGADGVLLDEGPASGAVGLRILNPDGSEAEKSGNGLRIFARYLHDRGRAGLDPFPIRTLGGTVQATVAPGGRSVTVDMGRASFRSEAIPVAGPPREVLDEPIEVGGRRLRFSAVTVGNPHCVVFTEAPSSELARELGPGLERDPRFPNRTNVQFAAVLDRGRLRIEIWERGAGYTLASGSSSCAAASVARRLGLVDAEVTVEMPGGALAIEIGRDFALRMRGPVTKVAEGRVSSECLAEPPP
jgi:diaminopimelate epimerase